MLILSGLMVKPGDNLSNSEAKEPKAEKCDGGGVEGDDELAEKERFAGFGCDILRVDSRLHIGRRMVIMLNPALHGRWLLIAISPC
jgi:hypothetical protein